MELSHVVTNVLKRSSNLRDLAWCAVIKWVPKCFDFFMLTWVQNALQDVMAFFYDDMSAKCVAAAGFFFYADVYADTPPAQEYDRNIIF